jgi:hypothetical protein
LFAPTIAADFARKIDKTIADGWLAGTNRNFSECFKSVI